MKIFELSHTQLLERFKDDHDHWLNLLRGVDQMSNPIDAPDPNKLGDYVTLTDVKAIEKAIRAVIGRKADHIKIAAVSPMVEIWRHTDRGRVCTSCGHIAENWEEVCQECKIGYTIILMIG